MEVFNSHFFIGIFVLLLNNRMQNIFMKKHILYIIIIIIGVLWIHYYFNGNEETDYEFVNAKKGDIIQEVSVTGRIKPVTSVDLAFEKSGKISNTYVNVGDRVFVGQRLVTFENSEFLAQLSQAEALLDKDKFRLDEIKNAVRPEEIQVQEVKVLNSKLALIDAKNNAIDKLEDSYTKADDAVTNKVDQFFSNPKTSNPQLLSSISGDQQLESEIESSRVLIDSVLKSFRSSLDTTNLSSDIALSISSGKDNLNIIKSFLDKIAIIINGLKSNSSLSKSTIDAWKADLSTARTNINVAITNLVSADEKLKVAESNLALSEQELLLKKAPATEDEVKIQEIQIKQSQANVDYYKSQVAKSILYSPIYGVVTMQDAKVGEIVNANKTIISIISESKFEIEANIPEVDIAKIDKGDSVSVTLDAYGRDIIFPASVTFIDPAETIIDGVSTYKITVLFNKEDERIKSGMTAKMVIATDKTENTIIVPQRAIIRKDGNKFVRILSDENITEVFVETGLRGSNGEIEILKGIKEGDKVIIFSGQ